MALVLGLCGLLLMLGGGPAVLCLYWALHKFHGKIDERLSSSRFLAPVKFILTAFFAFGDRPERKASSALHHVQAVIVLGFNFLLYLTFQSHPAATCFWVALLVGFAPIIAVPYYWVYEDKNQPWPPGSNVAWNAFMDITQPFSGAFEIFVAVLALMYMFFKYMSHLATASSDFNNEFWWVGLVLQMATQNSNSLGRSFLMERHFWRLLLSQKVRSYKESNEDFESLAPETSHIVARMVMSGLVNFSVSYFIVLMTPLLLAQSGDEIGFIFNACALNYITSLDDVDDKEFTFWDHRGEEIQYKDENEEAERRENADFWRRTHIMDEEEEKRRTAREAAEAASSKPPVMLEAPPHLEQDGVQLDASSESSPSAPSAPSSNLRTPLTQAS